MWSSSREETRIFGGIVGWFPEGSNEVISVGIGAGAEAEAREYS